MNRLTKFLPLLLALLFSLALCAQQNSGNVIVDDNGVLRWESSTEEIKGFGVNYTVPFAHAYRSAKKLGVDPLKAIDEDVYHFARLGFDLYRVHVWDTEISDTLGNLLFNEHLHAFDYLLKQLSDRGINYVLTPIAFWGNGWPEPAQPTPGFSHKYGKDNCLTNPEAIKAQENYLYQFLNHINPYTGIAYKDDPHLIAVEVSNEPHHREAPEKVTEFVSRMVKALRRTGYKKPIFYNTSHSVHLAEDYFKGGIQGGTFQWYPTGLGYQQELSGNMLPNVDNYLIPFDESFKKNKGAKLVYEFDAADVGRSYIYPAMARSFREAGIQIATHFSYDPLFLAYANTEYNTHYMNLAYTPQKALSLMICKEVFHQLPMYSDYGAYPENNSFGNFRVSYAEDLAILNQDDKFYYTNTTSERPKKELALRHIAGSGNSPLVSYDGTGAYFLDRLEAGVWRLEVMPDAMVVANPYGRNSLDKEVGVIQWNKREMRISLQDLGGDFGLRPLNEGNTFETSVSGGTFAIWPGAYLVVKKGIDATWKPSDTYGNKRLGEFAAPTTTVEKTYLVHDQPKTAFAGKSLQVSAEIIAPEQPEKVELMVDRWGGGRVQLERQSGFTYTATVPAEKLEKGFFRYYLLVHHKEGIETFPAHKKGMPYQWDFYDRTPYIIRVIDATQSVSLFDAEQDRELVSQTRWMPSLQLIPTGFAQESEFQINVEELHREDPENLNGPVIHDYTIKHYLNPEIGALKAHLGNKTKLVLKARALNGKPVKVQLALVDSEGNAFGKVIEVSTKMQEYPIALSELKKVKTVTMPRPYPTFLPYFFEGKSQDKMDFAKLEGLQLSIGPGISGKAVEAKHGVAVVSVWLE